MSLFDTKPYNVSTPISLFNTKRSFDFIYTVFFVKKKGIAAIQQAPGGFGASFCVKFRLYLSWQPFD
jgi:hypothetical protein